MAALIVEYTMLAADTAGLGSIDDEQNLARNVAQFLTLKSMVLKDKGSDCHVQFSTENVNKIINEYT